MESSDVPTLTIRSRIEEKESEELTPPQPERELDSISRVDRIPLWEMWPKEALLEKYQSMGPREFNRGYRQRAVSETDLLFPEAAIDRCLDRTLVVPDHVEKDSFWHKFPRDAGVDLAIATQDKEAAYFAMLGVLTTAEWHRYVMHLEFNRGLGWGQQIGLIAECHDRYMYDVVTVERNGYQEAIVRYFNEEGQQRPVPVRGLFTGAAQKKDIEVGLPGMAVEFENGRWHIPYGNARSRRMMEPFIEELRVYETPGFHSDAIMACFFARESRRMCMKPKPRIRMLA